MSRTGKINQFGGEVEIEWEITDFLALSKIDEKIESSTFNILGASWCLQCYPNGKTENDSLGWISLYLQREDTGPPVSMKFTFGLKTTKGRKKILRAPLSHVFQKCEAWGFTEAIMRSDVLDKKSGLVRFSVLTITCNFTHSPSNSIAILRVGAMSTEDSLCGSTASVIAPVTSAVTIATTDPVTSTVTTVVTTPISLDLSLGSTTSSRSSSPSPAFNFQSPNMSARLDKKNTCRTTGEVRTAASEFVATSTEGTLSVSTASAVAPVSSSVTIATNAPVTSTVTTAVTAPVSFDLSFENRPRAEHRSLFPSSTLNFGSFNKSGGLNKQITSSTTGEVKATVLGVGAMSTEDSLCGSTASAPVTSAVTIASTDPVTSTTPVSFDVSLGSKPSTSSGSSSESPSFNFQSPNMSADKKNTCTTTDEVRTAGAAVTTVVTSPAPAAVIDPVSFFGSLGGSNSPSSRVFNFGNTCTGLDGKNRSTTVKTTGSALTSAAAVIPAATTSVIGSSNSDRGCNSSSTPLDDFCKYLLKKSTSTTARKRESGFQFGSTSPSIQLPRTSTTTGKEGEICTTDGSCVITTSATSVSTAVMTSLTTSVTTPVSFSGSFGGTTTSNSSPAFGGGTSTSSLAFGSITSSSVLGGLFSVPAFGGSTSTTSLAFGSITSSSVFGGGTLCSVPEFGDKTETSSKNAGELFCESLLTGRITWKIPNISSLPKVLNYKVESSPFYFADAIWCLQMWPNGQSKYLSRGYIDLMIMRLHSTVPKHEISFKIYIQTTFSAHSKNFNLEKRFKAFFDTSCTAASGAVYYLQQSQLDSGKFWIAPDDILTVCCHMHTKNIPATKSYSKTDLAGSSTNVNTDVQLPAAVLVNKLLHDYKDLFLSDEDSDMTIQVKGQKFRAHKAILKARSTVFASIFRNMKEKATDVIDVEDCDPAIFPDFLRFLYCGSVEKMSEDNVFSLYVASNKYDVQDLKSECVEFMKSRLSVDTFCDTIALSLQYCEKELLKLATEFFAKNLPKIIVTVKWQAFLADNPTHSNELLIKALVSDKHTYSRFF